MNNYNLTSIQERNGNCFLQTPFYWGPGLPVHASKESIEQVLENHLNKDIDDVLKSGEIELFWVDEKQNMAILTRLLSKSPEALFLPDGMREQVLNASKRKQPYNFFVENSISRNQRGSLEMNLRLSCEIEPNKKGFKHGYNMSIIAGTSIYKLSVNGDLEILSAIENEKIILPNKVFNKDINFND